MEDHINIDTIHNRGAAVYFLSIYFMNMSYSGSAKLAVILAMISYFILLGWILCTIDWLLPVRLFFLALVYSHSLICMAWRGLSQKDPCRTVMSNRISFFEVEILDGKTKQQLCFLDKVEPNLTISDVKLMFHKCYPQWYPARQSIRLDPKGRSLKDDEILQDLPVGTTATLYFRDLGPQIGWTMVFLTEYAGPLFVYFLFYFRMPFFYGLAKAFTSSPHSVVHLACCCHSFHYIKRLIETLFVHRFSHGTMPLRSIVKNCFYYWGFAAWFAYYINHPLYTPPTYGKKQISLAMIMFLICETGNFSIHIVLSNLRIDGSRSRKIPFPTRNPFTWLFLFVSCPNYTYEVGSWISFTIMTQCAPVGLFTLIGFIQMTIWAKEKHRRYIREIKDYPRLRMSIIPFLL